MPDLTPLTEDEIELLRRICKESRGSEHGDGLSVYSNAEEATAAYLEEIGLAKFAASFHEFGRGFGSTYVATDQGRAVWEQKLFALAAA